MCSQFEQNIRGLQGENWQGKVPGWPWKLPDKGLIRPTNAAWTVDAEGPRARSWSLLPHWAREAKLKYATFNARAETLAEKPVFRDAWKRSQRCLVPASAWFEWPLIQGEKRRAAIHSGRGTLLLLAGLWEHWARAGEVRDSFTVITTAPVEELAWVHNRMPLLLAPEDAALWLHGTPGECESLLAPSMPAPMTVTPC